MRRRALVIVALALPLAASAWGSARLASWSGARLGGALAAVIPAIPRASWGDAAPADVALPGERDAAVVVADDAPAPGKKGQPRLPVHGLHVSAATVLRLAEAGVMPSGAPVPALGARPAGLSLSGVGGLGVGLRDGDVLTDVAGAPAGSPGAVVGAVIAARRRRAPAVSGHVWRGLELWQVVVDMPYPR